jgi:rod shape-determining protein MreC
VLCSLVLITVYFREPATGALHNAQGVGASVLRPFEVAVDRVARPLRDAYGYVSTLIHAKSENARLRAEADHWRQLAILNANAQAQNVELRRQLKYESASSWPKGYTGVSTDVISQPQNQFDQEVVIAAGSASGVRLHSPVVTDEGLVGDVVKVFRDTALVKPLVDQTAAATAIDLETRAKGTVRHGQAGSEALVFDRVPKDKSLRQGDLVVTAGTKNRELPSFYPEGIPIGYVTSAGQNDTSFFWDAQVQPLVDFSSLESVIVLVPNKPLPTFP